MSSKRYAAPLCLEPRRSKVFTWILGSATGGAFLMPFVVPAPAWLALLVCAFTLALAAAGYRQVFGGNRIVRAVWNEAGEWRLEFADGRCEEQAELEGDSFVTPEVVLLNFRAGRRRAHLVLCRDALDPDTHRRLRVRLRLQGNRKPEDP